MSESNYPLKERNIPDECNPQLQCYENPKHVHFFVNVFTIKTRLNKTCPLQNQVPAFPRQQCVLDLSGEYLSTHPQPTEQGF